MIALPSRTSRLFSKAISARSSEGRAACFLACLTLLIGSVNVLTAKAESLRLESPNGEVVVLLSDSDHLRYSVQFQKETVVADSTLGPIVDGQDLAKSVTLGKPTQPVLVDEEYATRGVHTVARNHYYEISVPIASSDSVTPWQLELRLYDNGLAFRFRVPSEKEQLITGESTECRLPQEAVIWRQSAKNLSYEAEYKPSQVKELPVGERMMIPLLAVLPDAKGYCFVTEANVWDYSDMVLEVAADGVLRSVFPHDSDGWKAEGEILTPWRVVQVTKTLNELVNSDLVRNLCPAPAEELATADWIQPGRSIWHWLTGGAPHLEKQRAWIDGTHELGYEYYLIDDGWRDWNGGGDNAWDAISELVQYANSQDVGIWAWVHSKYVFKPEERARYFQRAKDLGIVGLKIDFPHAPNVEWIRWYDDTLRAAAKAELMVDFHGAVKPTGRERTWPNEMTREAIRGREMRKLPASHDTVLPFLRYVQGHADYTPTLFIPQRLQGSTYAHELAMSVLYTSPYLCMGDHPSRYLASEAKDLLMALPATWDETVVLPQSKIGERAAFARRSGEHWYVALLNGAACKGTLSLDFLGEGKYECIQLTDADEDAKLGRKESVVEQDDAISYECRNDGGLVVWLKPID